jgi:dTDP-4-amino-4,6-dideoxygalactose transaminase
MSDFNSSPFTKTVNEFEKSIANFFNSPYAIATDSCTHALELCLRYKNYNNIIIPKRTYVSVPMLGIILNLNWKWKEENWKNYYYIGNTNIIDAAVLWEKNSYISNTYMCLSFQFKKHLSLGRGGAILLDNKEDYDILKKMSYDGRDLSKPWAEQDISVLGYHYYMTPETAKIGIKKFEEVKSLPQKTWDYKMYPDLSKMSIFKLYEN